MGEPRDISEIDGLYSSLYGDLRRLAHQRLLRSQTITLLNTTALVHESYLKFLAAGRLNISDRAEFLGYAARVMRSVIVDCVRRRRAERRGGDEQRVTLDPEPAASGLLSGRDSENEIIDVDKALNQLAKVDGRMVRVVEMRYFAASLARYRDRRIRSRLFRPQSGRRWFTTPAVSSSASRNL